MSTRRFAFPEEDPIIHHSLKLLYLTQASYNTEWNSTPHTHKNTEIFYITRGKGLFTIGKHAFPIQEDDVIVVNPMIAHTEKGIPESQFEYIVIGFSGLEFLNQSDTEQGYVVANYRDYKHEVLFYFKTLALETENESELYHTICQNLLEILIINLTRRTNLNLTMQPAYQGNKECVFVERYIHSHFKEDITLDRLAQLTYTNKFHLAHEFKKYKGISCIHYLIQKRIKEAKILLRTTNLPINDISSIVGFSSQSYFTQAFKKNTNMSPRQYKKACEKQL